ncbi:MAG: N-acetyl-gamma-glutamyl-phosphate reductase [Opitutaceae bacterium]|jgi:N-acetyl-gamma-glutamyl-phosphate reductase|nr:N-acetyl-gamma-glutamyl-phosphate reductase [Opitutaceae bacterium]
MKTKVFVDGSEGTTGLQIHGRLATRTDVELIRIAPEKRKDAAARAACLNAADIAFLCLPDDAAREAAALVTNPRTCVIDASTAHRTHPDWAYGLPELSPGYRERIRVSKRIANVGCHAAAFILAVRPLVRAGIVPTATALTCFSLTGYSGGGKKMIAAYEAVPPDPLLAAPRPYALGLAHKHLPEMRLHTGLDAPPLFVPVVANHYRGLAVTVQLPLDKLPGGRTPEELHAALAGAYAGETFVRVLPLNSEAALDVLACNGTNRADLLVTGNGRQALVICRLDNLGKGASGSAIQCMNLHLGLPEATGLV